MAVGVDHGNTLLVVVAFLAPVTRYVFGPWITSHLAAPTATLIAVSLAVISALGWYQPIPTAVGVWNSLLSAVVSASAVMIVWVFLLLLCAATVTESAAIGLLLLSLPLILLSSDTLCTHYVHWATANPLIKHKDMLEWRRLWSCRLMLASRKKAGRRQSTRTSARTKAAALQHQSYRHSLATVGIAVMLSLGCAMAASQVEVTESVESVILELLLLCSCIGVCFRVLQNPKAIGLFLTALVHFYSTGRERNMVPWCSKAPVDFRGCAKDCSWQRSR